MDRFRFDGWIAGIGTTSGVRIVVGNWSASPFGAFADVMIEEAGGRRLLLAPSRQIADFVASTYQFDAVSMGAVHIGAAADVVSVAAGPLSLELTTGRRSVAGWLLRCLPTDAATSPRWASAIDPVARVLLPGVRTAGSAGGGRREWYGATDVHAITAARGTLEGRELGTLAPLSPPVRFGFGSAPRRPCLVRIVTTIEASGPG